MTGIIATFHKFANAWRGYLLPNLLNLAVHWPLNSPPQSTEFSTVQPHALTSVSCSNSPASYHQSPGQECYLGRTFAKNFLWRRTPFNCHVCPEQTTPLPLSGPWHQFADACVSTHCQVPCVGTTSP